MTVADHTISIAPVSEDEIVTALKGIGEKKKAPGIDGFNSKFFTTTWGIIKEDAIASI